MIDYARPEVDKFWEHSYAQLGGKALIVNKHLGEAQHIVKQLRRYVSQRTRNSFVQ